MITSKRDLHKLIDEVEIKEIQEIIDFVEYLKIEKEKNNMKDLLYASKSSTDFWNNKIDNEVWNNV